MGFWMIVILANLIVGVLVGLTGVAGFLLPIVYTGPLGMGVPEGLALSFAAFIVSGALGAMNYKRAGNLDIPFGIRLSICTWWCSCLACPFSCARTRRRLWAEGRRGI